MVNGLDGKTLLADSLELLIFDLDEEDKLCLTGMFLSEFALSFVSIFLDGTLCVNLERLSLSFVLSRV